MAERAHTHTQAQAQPQEHTQAHTQAQPQAQPTHEAIQGGGQPAQQHANTIATPGPPSLIFPAVSEDVSLEARQVRFQQWAQGSEDKLQGAFAAMHFYSDFMEKDVINLLQAHEPRLLMMMEDYSISEKGQIHMHQLSADVDTFRGICLMAMRKLVNFDLDRFEPVEFALMRAAFQTSDPSKYPETDPVLKTTFEVLSCVDDVRGMIAEGITGGPPPGFDKTMFMEMLMKALAEDGAPGGELNASGFDAAQEAGQEAAQPGVDEEKAGEQPSQTMPEASTNDEQYAGQSSAATEQQPGEASTHES